MGGKMSRTKEELEKEIEFLKLELAKINELVNSSDVYGNYAKCLGRVSYHSNLDNLLHNFEFILRKNLPVDFYNH